MGLATEFAGTTLVTEQSGLNGDSDEHLKDTVRVPHLCRRTSPLREDLSNDTLSVPSNECVTGYNGSALDD